MTTRNALATARLRHTQAASGAPYQVSIQVWNRSYDHPNPARRSSIVSEVYLTQLPPSTGYNLANPKVTDRYGVDLTPLWVRTSGAQEEGFTGYTEYDTGGACGPGLPNVFWGCNTGIYDERCLADSSCDAMRLQTYRPTSEQLSAFNYVLGPVTFAFSIVLAAPPTAVRIHHSLIGGNGGDPAQRTGTLPDTDFIIQFP